MFTQEQKLRLISIYRTIVTIHRDALRCILEALQTDVLDGGCRFEDLYMQTFSIYG